MSHGSSEPAGLRGLKTQVTEAERRALGAEGEEGQGALLLQGGNGEEGLCGREQGWGRERKEEREHMLGSSPEGLLSGGLRGGSQYPLLNEYKAHSSALQVCPCRILVPTDWSVPG